MVSITMAIVVAIFTFCIGVALPLFVFWRRKKPTIIEIGELKQEIREKIQRLIKREEAADAILGKEKMSAH